jgi:hypothetical protein
VTNFPVRAFAIRAYRGLTLLEVSAVLDNADLGRDQVQLSGGTQDGIVLYCVPGVEEKVRKALKDAGYQNADPS